MTETKKEKINKSVLRKRLFKINSGKEIKIFAFCDIHGSIKFFEKLKRNVKKHAPAFVVCAGDFTMMNKQMEFFLHEFNKFKMPVMLVHGNHETPDKITAYLEENYSRNVVFIHKNLVCFKNICLTGYGGEGFSHKTEELDKYVNFVKSDLDKKNCKFRIFVSHAPPFGTRLDFIHNSHHGNESIFEALKKLKINLAICGHLHENDKIMDKTGDCVMINPSRDGTIVTLSDDYKIKSIDFLD